MMRNRPKETSTTLVEEGTNKVSNQSRMASVPLKQWMKFALVALIVIFFVIWLGNAWWLLLLPLFFDIYVTKFVPWSAWKKSKNPVLRSIAEWVDAILFALVAVYIINNYFFQIYKIPSSSLEKTLLVGDFLFVSKATYGPRNPMTPLSFPLAQHTLPLLNVKSYIEKPQVKYRRLKGLRNIERNDLVVFNFPAGDTVLKKAENPDYYTTCYASGYHLLKQGNPVVEPSTEECFRIGREYVRDNSDRFGEIICRPVDRRENYIKRCVAIPGDTLRIVDNQVYINGEKQIDIPTLQLNYFVQTDGRSIPIDVFDNLGISKDDIRLFNARQDALQVFVFLGYQPNTSGRYNPVYHLPLTQEMLGKLKRLPYITDIRIEPTELFGGFTYPLGNTEWTRDNYGPVWMPVKGETVELNASNYPLYKQIIENYEGNKSELKDGVVYINGQKVSSYTFQMDYYWMMGDNRHNSADSRYWGFVPEDHIVGQPVFVWLSLDKDKGLFSGKIRFDRFFKNARR